MRADDRVDREFTAFATASLRDLRSTAYLVCGDWHLAEDLAQEALLRMYRSWDKVEREEARLAYARRATVRLAIDHSRRPWRRERPGDLPDAGQPADDRHVDDRDLVARALETLAPRQRACIVLRYHLDCTVAETAQQLRCSEGTVKSQTSDALARMRAYLGDLMPTVGAPS